MIYPVPQKIEETGRVPVPKAFRVTAEHPVVADFCARNNIPISQEGNLRITYVQEESRALSYIEESRRVTDEKYIMRTEQTDTGLEVSVCAAGERGLWHALCTLGQQLESGELLLGEIEDYPLFEKRGYIEGFYGTPWTQEGRLSMLSLMAKAHMNTYYYAPKDDPYHRELWKKPYPERELPKLRELVEAAKRQFVEFHFCIAPGLSMQYSSEEDYAALLNKLRQVYDLGVRRFGLLLDDIPEELQYPEDIARFGSETVNAHSYLGNRLWDDLKALDAENRLTFCPLQYHGKGDEYFISKLGRGLDAEISLFWTGRNICSQELTVPEAITFIQSTRHQPLYWDNFPVNDAEMYNEMHLGYLTGRDTELYRYSEGIISNCMEYCECSKIPLLTVADFLWNPHAYNEKQSWNHAIDTVVGADSADFKILADHLLTSCLKVSNSPFMIRSLLAARSAMLGGDPMDALEMLFVYRLRLLKCCRLLRSGKHKMFEELTRWTDKLQQCHDVLHTCLMMMVTGSEALAERLQEQLNQYKRMPEVLTEFSFHSAIEQMLQFQL